MFDTHLPVAVADLARRQARDLYLTSIATLLVTACPLLRRRNVPSEEHFCSELGHDLPTGGSVRVTIRAFQTVLALSGLPAKDLRRIAVSGDIHFGRPFGLSGGSATVGHFKLHPKRGPRQQVTVHPDKHADAVLVIDIDRAASALVEVHRALPPAADG